MVRSRRQLVPIKVVAGIESKGQLRISKRGIDTCRRIFRALLKYGYQTVQVEINGKEEC
jgi:hypothetical protein